MLDFKLAMLIDDIGALPEVEVHGEIQIGGFSGDSVDSMHFEMSEEAILKMPKLPAPN